MAIYDSNFENEPTGSGKIANGDDNIRETRAAVKSALAVNHAVQNSEIGFEYVPETDVGKHKILEFVPCNDTGNPSIPSYALYRRKAGTATGASIETRLRRNSSATCSVQGVGLPVGTILDFAGASAPEGFLICDGLRYDPALYADLFSVISNTYGGTVADPLLPDLRGRITVGVGPGTDAVGATRQFSLAEKGGEYRHKLSEGEIPAHSHGIRGNGFWYQGTEEGHGSANHGNRSDKPVDAATEAAGGSTSHENVQPYITFNKIIKY